MTPGSNSDASTLRMTRDRLLGVNWRFEKDQEDDKSLSVNELLEVAGSSGTDSVSLHSSCQEVTESANLHRIDHLVLVLPLPRAIWLNPDIQGVIECPNSIAHMQRDANRLAITGAPGRR